MYSFSKFCVPISVIKCLCHLYPTLLIYQPIDKKLIILGIELIAMMNRNLSKLNSIFIPQQTQFVWILLHGDNKLITYMVCHWLMKDNDMLCKFVKERHIESVINNLLLNELTDDSLIIK